jgi:hypothetical protein
MAECYFYCIQGRNAILIHHSFSVGGTDAAELAKLGVEATTLLAMPWGNSSRAAVYHTPNDTIDHVEKDVVQAGLGIFFDVITNKDKIII